MQSRRNIHAMKAYIKRYIFTVQITVAEPVDEQRSDLMVPGIIEQNSPANIPIMILVFDRYAGEYRVKRLYEIFIERLHGFRPSPQALRG